MKVLITGGAGFIGSNLVDKCIDNRYEVIVIDNESSVSTDQYYWNDNAENYNIDICDLEQINPLFKEVDYVFHLAARSRIQSCVQNPADTVLVNCYGTCNVLECAKEHGVKKVIYSSTSSAYGMNEAPHIETQLTDCLNPYSMSKVAGENLCKMYTDLFDLKTVILRYFNVYGPRQSMRGEYAPVTGLFQRQAKEGLPLTIVPDGNQRRDFTHVSDVVEANILAMNNDIDPHYGEVFNIGGGKNYSVLELAALISDHTVFVSPRVGESRETLANINKAKEILGWNPKTTLKEWLKQEILI